MLHRAELGEILYNTRTRLRALETKPNGIFGSVITDELAILNSTPNTMAFIDGNHTILSKKLDNLITGVVDQISVQTNPDESLTLSTPQDIAITSSPIFSGLFIDGDIDVTGTVDGVDVSFLNTNYTAHVTNNTSAHFGQNLTISGNPSFNTINVTSTNNATNQSSGSLVIAGGMGIRKNLFIGGNLNTLGTTSIQDLISYSTIESTSQTTGGLIVFGGIGVGKTITSQKLTLTGFDTSLSIRGGNTISTTVTNATSVTTGALILSGGMGIGKNIYTGGELKILNTTGEILLKNITLVSDILISSSSTIAVYSFQLTMPTKIQIILFGYDNSTHIYNFVCENTYIFSMENGTDIKAMNGIGGTNEKLYWSHELNGWNFQSGAFSYTHSGGNSVAINFTNNGTKIATMAIHTIQIFNSAML